MYQQNIIQGSLNAENHVLEGDDEFDKDNETEGRQKKSKERGVLNDIFCNDLTFFQH